MSAEQRAWIRANARPNQWVDLDAIEADLEAQFGLRVQGTGPSAVMRNGTTITPYKGAWDQEKAAIQQRSAAAHLAPPPAGPLRLTTGANLVFAIAKALGMPQDRPGLAADYLSEAAYIEAQ